MKGGNGKAMKNQINKPTDKKIIKKRKTEKFYYSVICKTCGEAFGSTGAKVDVSYFLKNHKGHKIVKK